MLHGILLFYSEIDSTGIDVHPLWGVRTNPRENVLPTFTDDLARSSLREENITAQIDECLEGWHTKSGKKIL